MDPRTRLYRWKSRTPLEYRKLCYILSSPSNQSKVMSPYSRTTLVCPRNHTRLTRLPTPAKTDLLEARAPVGRPSYLIIYDPLFSHQHWSQNFYTRSAYLQKLKALPRPMDARNRSWWRRGWMWIVCKAANGHSDKKTSGRSSACGVPLSGYAKAAISLSIKVTFFHLRTGDLVQK